MSRTKAAGRVRRRKRWASGDRDCDRLFESRRSCPDHPTARVHKVWVEEQISPGAGRLARRPVAPARAGDRALRRRADEAPEVYKRLSEVLAAPNGSIRGKRTLRPFGVAMAGRDVVDPYKD